MNRCLFIGELKDSLNVCLVKPLQVPGLSFNFFILFHFMYVYLFANILFQSSFILITCQLFLAAAFNEAVSFSW